MGGELNYDGTRLDLAIGKAFTEDVFTDEINTPLRNSHRR
jgi:hypothetical protein